MLKHFITKLSYACCLAIIIAGLASCASTQSPDAVNPVLAAPAHYLKLAAQTTGEQANNYRLQAADAYIQLQQYADANHLLQQIAQRPLSADNQAQFWLTSAKLSLLFGNASQAYQQLNRIQQANLLANAMQIQRHQLFAQTYDDLGQTLNSIEQRLQLTDLLLNNSTKQQNNAAIWRLSKQLTDLQLQNLRQDNSQPRLQGWAALTLIARQDNGNAEQLLKQLRQWRQQFPNHPANALLSSVLPDADALLQSPTHIAILLPTQGRYASQAQAVMQGFLLAYYQQPLNARPQIDVIDTSQQSISDAYQQAKQQNADMIVGPLLKDNVEQLAQQSPDLPVLALNYTDDNNRANFYEFGISPRNQASQMAERLWASGKKKVLVIQMNGNWNANALAAFKQRFTQLGGQVLQQLTIKLSDNVDQAIKRLLHVEQSQIRIDQMQAVLGETIKSTPRRRQDIQAIVLNVAPNNARQILPLLRFYYAGSIPVFASPMIYNGVPNARRDSDLNGVVFASTPWAMANTPMAQQARRQLQRQWPSGFMQYNQLYAIGSDAYQLLLQLNRLQLFPQSTYDGYSGRLHLDSNNNVYRDLIWAKFERGLAKPW